MVHEFLVRCKRAPCVYRISHYFFSKPPLLRRGRYIDFFDDIRIATFAPITFLFLELFEGKIFEQRDGILVGQSKDASSVEKRVVREVLHPIIRPVGMVALVLNFTVRVFELSVGVTQTGERKVGINLEEVKI